MLPLPVNHNGTIDVRVGVFDEELAAETVAFISVNMTPKVTDNPSNTGSEDLESSNLEIVGGIGIAVILLLVVLVAMYVRGSRSTPKNDSEIDESSLRTESTPERSVGLLARAKDKM
jgi:hypothetical protein